MLSRKTYFIREHVGMLKLSDTFDILDPESNEQIGIAKEKPGALMHVLRLLVNKRMLPTKVFVYQGDNPEDEEKLQFMIHKKFTLLNSRVEVCDPTGKVLGILKGKMFSMGGAFRVLNVSGEEVALVKGDWKGWNFKLTDNSGKELGSITKKWAGIGKELFTTADNYMISLNQESSPAIAILLLAAGLAVDTVFKEK